MNMNEDKLHKILVIAYQNNPDWISVPLEGWHEYKNLRSHFEVKLVTHAMNAPNLRKRGIPDNEVLYLDLGIIDRFTGWFLVKILKENYGSQKATISLLFVYWLFEFLIWLKLGKQIKNNEYALVHRLTPVTPIIGSPLAWLMRKLSTPFSVGPLNGGLPWPKGYENANKEKEFVSNFRNLAYYLPFIRSMYKYSNSIIFGSSFAWLEGRVHASEEKLFFFHENGIPECDIKPIVSRAAGPIKLCFIGRLVPYKNCNVVISAAASFLKQGVAELHIIGDGMERTFLEDLASSLGVKSRVIFHGMLCHKEAMGVLETCNILAFPSIREFGGGVVIEAMAKGVVPIVMRYGGPADIVTDDCGFRLPLKSEEDTIKDLAGTIELLIKSPEKVTAMSLACCERAKNIFSWEKKTEFLARVLRWTITNRDKPDFVPDCMLRSNYPQFKCGN